MCTGRCSLFVAISLYPLVLLSIICNILLFFPDWSTQYIKEGHITDQVKYLGGFIGGGIMVLIPALYIHLTGENGCCANRFGMLFSIMFAALGVTGAGYSFIVALNGFADGLRCRTDDDEWTSLLKDDILAYVSKSKMRDICREPNVLQFNEVLFITLMVASVLQALLCSSQIINGLFGCLFGTCNEKQVLCDMSGIKPQLHIVNLDYVRLEKEGLEKEGVEKCGQH